MFGRFLYEWLKTSHLYAILYFTQEQDAFEAVEGFSSVML